MIRRALTVVAAAILAMMLGAAPSVAGGSWLEGPDNLQHGESVTFSGDVSPGQLGWVEDGPFLAYLRVNPDAVDDSYSTAWPVIHETDLLLGTLEIDDRGAGRFAEVSVGFEVPAGLPPGAYDLVYCNDPCTNGFGDLIGGIVYVGVTACGEECDQESTPAVGGGERPPGTALEEVRLPPIVEAITLEHLAAHDPLVVDREPDPISPWVLVAAVIGTTAVVTVTVVAIRRRRGSTIFPSI